MNKIWKDEQGSVTGWFLLIFFVCALLFGWLPHVLMSKNHIAAMTNFDLINSTHFLQNAVVGIVLIVILAPLALLVFFSISNDIDDARLAKTAKERREAEIERQKKMDYEAPNNVIARYMVQKEIEHPETIVERPGTVNINKYRAERQQK